MNDQIEHVKVRVLPDGRMTRKDAAAYLGHAQKTLAMWQLNGKGPVSVKVGGKRFYFKSTLDAFINEELESDEALRKTLGIRIISSVKERVRLNTMEFNIRTFNCLNHGYTCIHGTGAGIG